MALALCHVNIVSRGQGHSAVGGSAYRAGIMLMNEYNGRPYNYSRKQDVIYSEIMLPENAPEWMKEHGKLWNSIELVEPRKDAQLARGMMIALPIELSQEQNIALVKEFAQKFVDQGMVADIAIHDRGDGNPHAHILLTMRPITPEGQWGAKSITEHVLNGNGEKIKLSNGNYKSRKINTTDWDNRENVKIWREWYANITNKHLEINGYKERISHKSLEDQGLEQQPTVRLSRIDWEREQRGEKTERGNLNRKIREENKRREALKQEIAELKQEQAKIQKEVNEKEKTPEPQPHHEVEFEDRYRRPTPPSYKERYQEATKKRVVRGSNSHRQFTTPAREGGQRDRKKMEGDFKDRYKRPLELESEKTREQQPEQKHDEIHIKEYEARKQQRKEERTLEKNLSQEYDERKADERAGKQDYLPTPQPKPHHKAKFEDRYKPPLAPEPKQEKTDHERQHREQERKNKDDDKTHNR